MKCYLIAMFIFAVLMTSLATDICDYGGHQWPVGETYAPPGKCMILTCESPTSVTGKTCPSNMAIGCKYIPQDNSKPYPDCCAHYDCDERDI